MDVKVLKLGGIIDGAKYVAHAPNTVPFLVEFTNKDLIPGEDPVPLLKSKIASMLYILDHTQISIEFVKGLL